MLLFASHVLESFPDLLKGISSLSHEKELEVIILARGSREFCATSMQSLRLEVPIVPVDKAFYHRFQVRVMPFVTLLDPAGTVQWQGLVNTETQLLLVWQLHQNMALMNH